MIEKILPLRGVRASSSELLDDDDSVSRLLRDDDFKLPSRFVFVFVVVATIVVVLDAQIFDPDEIDETDDVASRPVDFGLSFGGLLILLHELLRDSCCSSLLFFLVL